MAQKRVLIVSQYPLFDAAIEAALRQEPEVEVVGVCRGDIEAAYVEAQTLQPDVVLLIARPDAILKSALRLLEEVSDCLIQINATNGLMKVYRRERVNEATVEDLLIALQVAKEALGNREVSDAATSRVNLT
ncbi:MAG: hypothetical protein ACE5LU_25420 [Anaerolineae bacterium]